MRDVRSARSQETWRRGVKREEKKSRAFGAQNFTSPFLLHVSTPPVIFRFAETGNAQRVKRT
jgi:hypothetical protein